MSLENRIRANLDPYDRSDFLESEPSNKVIAGICEDYPFENGNGKTRYVTISGTKKACMSMTRWAMEQDESLRLLSFAQSGGQYHALLSKPR